MFKECSLQRVNVYYILCPIFIEFVSYYEVTNLYANHVEFLCFRCYAYLEGTQENFCEAF